MMMGVWFLSSFFGNYLSGYLGTFWEKMPRETFFLLMFALSFAASAIPAQSCGHAWTPVSSSSAAAFAPLAFFLRGAGRSYGGRTQEQKPGGADETS